jgi:hypothetical protein
VRGLGVVKHFIISFIVLYTIISRILKLYLNLIIVSLNL